MDGYAKSYRKFYYENNKERLQKNQAVYREKHREYYKEYNRLYRQNKHHLMKSLKKSKEKSNRDGYSYTAKRGKFIVLLC